MPIIIDDIRSLLARLNADGRHPKCIRVSVDALALLEKECGFATPMHAQPSTLLGMSLFVDKTLDGVRIEYE